MTGDESRKLQVGTRVCWMGDKEDAGTVTEKTWSSIVIKWHRRDTQTILHNDMAGVSVI
jgi:hypothetical protein